MSPSAALRERQASVVEAAILDALANLLETEDPESIPMAQVAEDAGVSLRTLYRYFPSREDLFDAVGNHVVARLGLPPEIKGPDDIAANFLESSARGARHPRLMRSLLDTSLGRRARSGHRRRRITGISRALAEVTSHIDRDEAARRTGAIVYLSSLSAWVTISEECGISADDARLGVAWALEALVDTLRRENETSRKPARRRRT
jgi:AcrR family transcriptional regulator